MGRYMKTRSKQVYIDDGEEYIMSVEGIIENPIVYFYFLSFCQAEHNAENLMFLVDVKEFRDTLLQDKDAWRDLWRSIDSQLSDYVIDIESGEDRIVSSWPSSKVDRSEVHGATEKIVKKYLIDGAPHEISIHSTIRTNTLQRATLVDLYGPEVFTEATTEPLQILQGNILPRFLKSETYIKLRRRLTVIVSSPSKIQLVVPSPSKSVVDRATPLDFPPEREFEFDEVLNCQILYGEFLKFLQNSFCSGNLLCVRLICIFEDAITCGKSEKAEDVMWTIYSFFVAAGSEYEIQSFRSNRRQLMESMANPTVEMFSELKYALMQILARNFTAFKVTEEYNKLADLCRSKISLQAVIQAELSSSIRGSLRRKPSTARLIVIK